MLLDQVYTRQCYAILPSAGCQAWSWKCCTWSSEVCALTPRQLLQGLPDDRDCAEHRCTFTQAGSLQQSHPAAFIDVKYAFRHKAAYSRALQIVFEEELRALRHFSVLILCTDILLVSCVLLSWERAHLMMLVLSWQFVAAALGSNQ